MEIYIQLGAGAGDRDIRTNCRDGFTDFVKKTGFRTVSLNTTKNPIFFSFVWFSIKYKAEWFQLFYIHPSFFPLVQCQYYI